MDSNELNRNEKATPHKLKRARQEGRGAKSREIVECLSLCIITLVICAFWRNTYQQWLLMSQHWFHLSARLHYSVATVVKLMSITIEMCLALVLPLLLTVLLAHIAGVIVQHGVVWSMKLLKPNFQRLNPVTGCQKLFSLNILFAALKNTFKLIIGGWVIYYVLQKDFLQLLAMMHRHPEIYPQELIHLGLGLLLHLLAVLVVFAFIDFLFVRWQHNKDMRMSRREQQEEHKRREGDPKIKHQQSEMQKELRRRAMSLTQVKTADMVIVNPTHLAVAILYDHKVMPAPKVVAKGAGELALAIGLEARRHNVSVFQDEVLAWALFHEIQLDEYITPIFFPSIIRLLFEAYRRKGGCHGDE